jgi:hypothetical protein
MRKYTFRPKPLCLTAAALLLTLGLSASVSAQAITSTTNDFVPFAQLVFVPCADGGAGEFVFISGTLHIQTHVTINDNHATVKNHFQPQGATGVGLSTGDTYRAVGVTQVQQTIPLDNGAATFTFINNFRLIGPGPNNNLQVHQTVHQTVNANGEVTSTVVNTSVECR